MLVCFLTILALIPGYFLYYLFGGVGVLLGLLLCAILLIAALVWFIKKTKFIVENRKSRKKDNQE